MILVDANVFMYAAGTDHPLKEQSCRLLEAVASNSIQAGVDAEVLQEILHRYRALNRWEEGRKLYDLVRVVVPVVVSVSVEVLDQARALLDAVDTLSARDALHAAACFVVGADGFCTFDRDFDRIPGLRRIEPAGLL